MLNGGNVALEHIGSTVTVVYIRGINLVYSVIGTRTNYYLYNGHGDVVQLVDVSGALTKEYDYDAFGNEENINAVDVNPFRYSGEYFDIGSGLSTGDFIVGYNSEYAMVNNPGTGANIEAIVLKPLQPYADAHTNELDLSPNTVYVLEFEYWSDTDNNYFYTDLFPDDLPQTELVPTQTVQKATLEISSGSTNMMNAYELRYLYIGQGSSVCNIAPLGQLSNLIVLHVEGLKQIKDYSSLIALKNLEQLVITGPILGQTPVKDCDFLRDMPNLRSISLSNVNVMKKYSLQELSDLRASLPNLHDINNCIFGTN